MLAVSAKSQLAQLAGMTVLSIDSGNLDVVREYAATSYITDATTNPLFVSQAGLSGDPTYAAMVDEAVAYAKARASGDEAVSLAMDRLAVNLGLQIAKLVDGYVSTEVDVRLSYETGESLSRARRIIAMYEEAGVPRSRILIKLAGTWEGLCAAEELQKEGIDCNITLVFAFVQAVVAAQRGIRLISPFPGRVMDWHKSKGAGPTFAPADDPGVVLCSRIFGYYKKHAHGTICMPASWRPSRGPQPEYALDEIIALAGSDRMTIPPQLLEKLAASEEPLPRVLEPVAAAASCADEPLGGGMVGEELFRSMMAADGCGPDKLEEGIKAFVADTEKLELAIRSKF
jgi:transaldolase